LEHAKLVLLDILGVILTGSKSEEAGRNAHQLSVNLLTNQGVTCPGKPEAFDSLNAALINEIAGSTLDCK
jgi:2-methylcitrate dehydratase PrpD